MSKTLTVSDFRMALKKSLKSGGIEAASLEASLIIEHLIGLDRSEQILCAEDLIPPTLAADGKSFVARRLAGEPLDHILEYREFYGFRFEVSRHVLTPRSETEILVDFVLDRTSADQSFTFVDLGTGSGAIAISILKHRNKAVCVAIDISSDALRIAEENAKQHGVFERLDLRHENWGASLKGSFDFVVSNPPYIDREAMKRLPPEVEGFDPEIALSGGDDGLKAYKSIIGQVYRLLRPGGYIVLEIGYDQAESVCRLLEQWGFIDIFVEQDLAKHDRRVSAKRPE